ncbi:MAG: hypothetical protein ACTSPY_11945 [Candidatus Helarchaeota archaeon]
MLKEQHYTCPECGMFITIKVHIRNIGKDGQNQVSINNIKCTYCNKDLIKMYSKISIKTY